MLTCELRCHLLDRKDQLESCKSSRKYLEDKKQELFEEIVKAQKKYDEHLRRMERREMFIKLVESTLSQQWIDRPDILEKEWFKNAAN